MSHTEKRWIKRVLIAGLLIIGVVHLSIIWAQREDFSEVSVLSAPHDSLEDSSQGLPIEVQESNPVHFIRFEIYPKHLPKPTGVFRAL